MTCDKKSNIHRGLVKWYDRGLQKPLVGVRFSHPLLSETPEALIFSRYPAFFIFRKIPIRNEIKRKIKLFIDTVLRFNAMILNHSFSINQI